MKCEELEEGDLIFILGEVHRITADFLYVAFHDGGNTSSIMGFDRRREHHWGDFDDDNGVHSHVFGAKATKNSSSVQAGSSTRAAGPFTVEGDADEKEFSVVLGTRFVASFPYGRGSFYTEPGAKAAAQVECDRLNAEYRKEMEK